MRRLLLVVVLGLVAAPVWAQTVISKPGGLLEWDYLAGVDPSSYTHQIIVDGGTPAALTATCVPPVAPATTWKCQAPLPALATGSHTLAVVATATVNGTPYHGAPSASLTVLSVIIGIPQNLRVTEGVGPVTAQPKTAPTKKPGGGL